jgi:hypothetical protein
MARLINFVGDEVANIVTAKYGAIDYEWGIKSASTDFVGLISLVVDTSLTVFL